MDKDLVRISKFVSLVLRHQPEKFGISLDAQGWADVDALLRAAEEAGVPCSEEVLHAVVAQNDKQRFAFNADETRIRARQGHSFAVDLGLPPVVPPMVLFHGTARQTLPAIMREGLLRLRRQYVHLSADAQVAWRVGQRHGQPVVLTVQAGAMHADGLVFFCSENGVWLTEHVPVRYVVVPG